MYLLNYMIGVELTQFLKARHWPQETERRTWPGSQFKQASK